jgi:hypothetical protein
VSLPPGASSTSTSRGLSALRRPVIPATPAPLPTQIKVGPLVYDVIADELAFAKTRVESDSPTLIGRLKEKELQILLDPELPLPMLRACLLHEALHTITAGTTLAAIVSDADPDDRDERIVGVLELPLLAMLRDNPELVAFLLG